MSTTLTCPSLAERFNCTGFSRWVNSPTGRGFRLTAGTTFLVVGFLLRDSGLGIALMAWSVVPLSAGAFNLCWISAVLGGPLRSMTIRQQQA
ncbi:DUF2892 domain-containing protein [Nocardioides jejuensis]|uniref:DUF2892 domain-containing protein n=1 Tax=Nocardioides jejuensis TaxID=2502782 RepID=A0A4R1CHI4_9ACTN|nr:DUF2892 domain-containing protein [Nocardioides jejuensis]TCJ29905.1 DUF2892 domain-containing protein [Nocardioides jejuensis]